MPDSIFSHMQFVYERKQIALMAEEKSPARISHRLPGYILYVLVCVYAINGARDFLSGFWQMFVILSVMNVMDRFLVDGWWVGHTKAWTIPGTEDLKPYITRQDKCKKWIMGTVGMAVVSAVLAGIAALIM